MVPDRHQVSYRMSTKAKVWSLASKSVAPHLDGAMLGKVSGFL